VFAHHISLHYLLPQVDVAAPAVWTASCAGFGKPLDILLHSMHNPSEANTSKANTTSGDPGFSPIPGFKPTPGLSPTQMFLANQTWAPCYKLPATWAPYAPEMTQARNSRRIVAAALRQVLNGTSPETAARVVEAMDSYFWPLRNKLTPGMAKLLDAYGGYPLLCRPVHLLPIKVAASCV
jgi:hypothetical protein